MKCEIESIVYKSKNGKNACNGCAATCGDSLCKQLPDCTGIIWMRHVEGEKVRRIKFLEEELETAFSTIETKDQIIKGLRDRLIKADIQIEALGRKK